VALIALLAAKLAFAGCRLGGDSEDDTLENSPQSNPKSITISPADKKVAKGGSVNFTVTPENSVVKWSIKEKVNPGTTISDNGVLNIDKDETAVTLTVVATLNPGSGKKVTAEATVTVTTAAECFSNSTIAKEDSVIDLITAAHNITGVTVLYFQLEGKDANGNEIAETVSFTSGTDINTTGLVLNSGNSPANVVIDGGGREIKLEQNNQGSVITVETGVTLTLRNIVFTGTQGHSNGNTSPLIKVDGGELILETGAVIKGNWGPRSTDSINATPGPAGVYVKSGAFTMNEGSSITENFNSGVVVGNKDDSSTGTFTMNGGIISNNTNGYYDNARGLGVDVESGTFIMNGGTISGNAAARGKGAGVYVAVQGIFIMNVGTIKGNMNAPNILPTSTGDGVYVTGGTFTMKNGTISGEGSRPVQNGGGGVHVVSGGTFNMEGGTIMNYGAQNGGGVYVVSGSTFNMKGGTISGNKAVKTSGNGGGVYVSGTGSKFNMEGGTISGNEAAEANGGGVYVAKNSAFNMKGGTISGNKAVTISGNGGGVYVVTEGSFVKTGGIIYGGTEDGKDMNGIDLKNTAGSANGHAVYVAKNGKGLDNTVGPNDILLINANDIF
jgi:hypothetical protein